MVVLFVSFEMLGEVLDAFSQDRDLNFRRSGISFVGFELLDQFLFVLSCNRHGCLHPFLGLTSCQERRRELVIPSNRRKNSGRSYLPSLTIQYLIESELRCDVNSLVA